MSKKLLALLLAAVVILSVALFAFADEPLPDVDIYAPELILANSYNSIGCYAPEQISYFYDQGISTKIYDDAVALVEDCRAAGNLCFVNCAYRDYGFNLSRAQTLISLVYDSDPVAFAAECLGPGCNDHQTGLAFDITANGGYAANYDGNIDEDAVNSPAWAWMKEHCAEYGFIVRYPEGKENYYGVPCHPTHLRYVGREAAEYIMKNNLCLEEFLMLYGLNVNLPK